MINLRKELEMFREDIVRKKTISQICGKYEGDEVGDSDVIISCGYSHWVSENTVHLKVGVSTPDGSRIDQYWLKNGKFHREDGPAIEIPNSHRMWCIDGRGHREDGPALEYSDGKKVWYKDGKLHRLDGPAIEYEWFMAWYKEDKLHREDGPAREYGNVKEWYLEGTKYSEEEYNKIINKQKYDIKCIRRYNSVNLTDLLEYLNRWKSSSVISNIIIETINKDEEKITEKKITDDDLDSLKDERRVHVQIDYKESITTHYWYKNGKLHREAGPAREDWNGSKMWYLEGERYSEEEHNKIINEPKEMDLFPLTLLGSLVLLKSVRGASLEEQVGKDIYIVKNKEDGME